MSALKGGEFLGVAAMMAVILAWVLITKGEPSLLDGWRAQANAGTCLPAATD